MWTGSGAYLGISVVSNQVVGLTVLTQIQECIKRGDPLLDLGNSFQNIKNLCRELI